MAEGRHVTLGKDLSNNSQAIGIQNSAGVYPSYRSVGAGGRAEGDSQRPLCWDPYRPRTRGLSENFEVVGGDKGPMGITTAIMLALINRGTIDRDTARTGTSINQEDLTQGLATLGILVFELGQAQKQ